MSMNLAGSVFDELGNPINGATVTVKNEAGTTVATTTTGPTGAWNATTLTATNAHTVGITLAGSQVRKIWGDIRVQVGELVVIDKFELAAGGVLVLPAGTLPGAALIAGSVPNAALAQMYMVPIARTVLAAAAANIDFQNIPQTYGTLMLVIRGRSTDGATNAVGLLMRLNANLDGAYDTQIITAYGATVIAEQAIAATSAEVGALASAGGVATGTGSIVVTLPQYTQAGLVQSWISTAGEVRALAAGGLRVHTSSGIWRYSDPITRITLTPTSGNLGVGTIATIYGLPS